MSKNGNLVDGDTFLTKENFIFTVIGYEHPKDRFFCFLKYIPAELKHLFPLRMLRRMWKLKIEGATLCRAEKLYTAENYQKLISAFKEHFPEYVYFCPYREKEVISVPKSFIKKAFPAKQCLKELLAKKKRNKLEDLALELVELLSKFANVPIEDFGLRGSIALNMHSSVSDIDLAVYGAQNFRRVEKAVERLAEKGEIQYITTRRTDFQRRFRGKYRGKVFMYNAVRKPQEISVHYGKYSYKSIKPVKFKCRVVDDSEGMFRPAIYRITGYTPLNEQSKLEGYMVPERVTSMIGHYRNIARNGQKIRVFGTLERVENLENNNVFYQVVVGSGKTSNEHIFVK